MYTALNIPLLLSGEFLHSPRRRWYLKKFPSWLFFPPINLDAMASTHALSDPEFLGRNVRLCLSEDFIFALWFTLAGASWLLFLLVLLL